MRLKRNIERDLFSPVTAYFMKKFKQRKDIVFAEEVTSEENKRVDMIIIVSENNMHTIEIESNAKNMFSETHGYNQIKEHKGNFKWLVLPEEEYISKKEEIISRCKEEKVGLLTVKQRDAERYMKQIGNTVLFNLNKKFSIFNKYNAPRIDRKNHVMFYPELFKAYEEIKKGDYSNVADFDYS